jgi:predicted DNA-binding transcriptional regulator YafY
MLETSARLLRLLSLLSARPFWRGDDLAGRLEVTPRTLRRDVARLRAIGYPVDADPGPAGGYRLGPGGRLPPLLLEDDEAVAVAVPSSPKARPSPPTATRPASGLRPPRRRSPARSRPPWPSSSRTGRTGPS